MRRNHRVALLAAVLAVLLFAGVAAPAAADHDGGDCTFPVSETDATGTNVTIEEPPETVVTIDAASAQTLWEIGAENRITGMPVRSYTEYLEGSEERTDVLTEDGSGVDVETVVELDPDLVVAPNFTPPETVEQLRGAGLTVYQSPFEESFEAVYAKTELYGHFVGECEAAGATAEETRQEVESIRETVADREAPRVLYYFFGFTAGSETFIGDIVETAGGENVAATAGIQGFQEISSEVIVEQDPEWIVTPDNEGAVDTSAEPFPSTTAVQNDRVLVVDANLVSQAAPRVVVPLRAMAEAFHPEAFEETETPTPTASPEPAATETPTESGRETPDGSTGDGAGFGVVVAVLALLGAAFLARRR